MASFRVTYTGSDVVRLGKAGLFMPGTSALVDDDDARAAQAHGQFKVEALEGAAKAPAPAPAAKPAAAAAAAPQPVAEEKTEKAPPPIVEGKSGEVKLDDKKDEKKAEAKTEPKTEPKKEEAAK